MAKVIVDSNVVIAALDGDNSLHADAAGALRALRLAGVELAVSTITVAETLSHPSGDVDAVAPAKRFFESSLVTIEPVSHAVAVESARIRTHHPSLRLPDALIAATATTNGPECRLLTADKRLRRLRFAMSPRTARRQS